MRLRFLADAQPPASSLRSPASRWPCLMRFSHGLIAPSLSSGRGIPGGVSHEQFHARSAVAFSVVSRPTDAEATRDPKGGPGCCPSGWGRRAGNGPHVSPFVCSPSATGRLRHSHGARAAGAPGRQGHDGLPRRVERGVRTPSTGCGCPFPANPEGLGAATGRPKKAEATC